MQSLKIAVYVIKIKASTEEKEKNWVISTTTYFLISKYLQTDAVYLQNMTIVEKAEFMVWWFKISKVNNIRTKDIRVRKKESR